MPGGCRAVYAHAVALGGPLLPATLSAAPQVFGCRRRPELSAPSENSGGSEGVEAAENANHVLSLRFVKTFRVTEVWPLRWAPLNLFSFTVSQFHSYISACLERCAAHPEEEGQESWAVSSQLDFVSSGSRQLIRQTRRQSRATSER